MSEKKLSWADIADEEEERVRMKALLIPKWVPPHVRDPREKLKSLFSKEKPRK